MNVILVMVISADGKTTKGADPNVQSWTSPEDQAHFREIKSRYRVLVMGKNTYEIAKHTFTPSSKLRRIVLTHNPKRYVKNSVPGQLEFTDESPTELVRRLEQEGYSDLLLTGGNRVNMAFLSEQLITECLLTVEPVWLGNGEPLFAGDAGSATLTLHDSRKLNEQGTLVLHYSVTYDHQSG